MKKYNFKRIISPLGKTLAAFTIFAGLTACDNVIYDFEENCDDPVVTPPDGDPEPEPDLTPGNIRIYVRTNPGSGGTSHVQEVGNEDNNAETQEGLYVYIDVKANSPYTLTATETNPGYKFVRWHDDTNNGDLTADQMVIENIKSDASAKYTAIFEKIEEKDEPAPGFVRIFVKTNPGSAGTSAVYEADDQSNKAQTDEGIYVSIDVVENGAYTLSAEASNPEYKFIRWHDDTNNSDLTDGLLQISDIPATASVKYTALFEKIGPAEPEPEPEVPGYYVKYVFERNMQFTDGFSQKVNSVDLYVFNSSGSFIAKYHEDGVALKDADYLMELKDLKPGDYELIAWCGLYNNAGHFTVPADGQISRNDHVVCTMATSSDAAHNSYQAQNLSPLFHGRKTDATYLDNNEKQVHTVYLTKNTNNVNITLQHRQGLEFAKDRFTVTMHDQNDVMRHDNSMHPDVQTVEYRPYRTVMGSTRSGKTRAEVGSTVGNYMQVELSTARLMTQNNPILEVYDNESGKTVFSIPLVKWALQLRSSNYKGMDDQEYLDREDNYNMMLWLDSNKDDGWFGAEIKINNWHVVDDSSDIK